MAAHVGLTFRSTWERIAAMIDATIKSSEFVAWACFIIGTVVLLAGVVIGLILSLTSSPQGGASAKDAKKTVEDAQTKLDDFKTTAVAAAKEQPSTDKAKELEKKSGALGSALEEVGGIVGSLPERLRFSGLLVLIGALLMSVATVQFGGHPIFG
jgi:hypothetical protein